MKSVLRILFFVSLCAIIGSAQNFPPGTFKHIIIVVQENRTPDNLFGAGPLKSVCGVEDPFEPGVDIVNGGYSKYKGQLLCNTPIQINASLLMGDPGHYFSNWNTDYDNGNMDGFCEGPNCPEYSFVPKTDVQPYFDLATNYGFANYFFQTNEGPSFAAHQFLFTGTSAPVAVPNDTYQDFGADNETGCPGGTSTELVDPRGSIVGGPYPKCYTHDSLVTAAQDCSSNNCDKGFSWRYYVPTSSGLWVAPAAIPEVCYGQNQIQSGACSGVEWNNHIVVSSPTDAAPILTDIQNCNLPGISWVIPDALWSDHYGDDRYKHNPPLGPSWVGDIVDAIGNSWAVSNHGCDYWGSSNSPTAEPTAIFVLWDDWGGWFDHVLPPAVYRSTTSDCSTNDAPNGWGCGYTYGFRVPLLVVSQYTPAGYVSGAMNGTTTQDHFPYQHDVGSILAFVENNFEMPFIAPPYYADYNALDWDATHQHVPLSDFFDLTQKRAFANISTSYSASFFQNYYLNTPSYQPNGPDNDSE